MKLFFQSLLFLLCAQTLAQVPSRGGVGTGSGRPDYERAEVALERPGREGTGYYQQNGKFGFVLPGNNRQEAIYDKIIFSSKGFIVKKDNKFGLADKNGNPIGSIDYDSIADLYNKSFLVKKNGLFGTLTEEGKYILSIQYPKILYSDQQVSFIEDKNGQVQMIFDGQKKPFPQTIEQATLYANLTIIKSNGKFGIVKKETILPMVYDSIYISAQSFNHYGNNGKKAAQRNLPVVDVSKSYQLANYLTVVNQGKCGMFDGDGNEIFPIENDAVNNLSTYSYYTVKKGNLYGIYFNLTNQKTDIVFDKVYADGIGYVMAVKNGKGGAYTIKGDLIVPFEYDPEFIAQYSFGLRVTKDKKRGIIGKDGTVLIPPLYTDINTFYEGGFEKFVRVSSGEKHGVANLQGQIIIPLEYEYIGVENGMFKVVTPKPERKFGLCDKQGKVIIPAEYQWITDSDTRGSNIIILQKDSISYNFLNAENAFIYPENVCSYGYVLDQDNLLNPFNSNNQYLLLIQGKNQKYGLLNEKKGTADIPLVYDAIYQRFEALNHTYFSVKKDNKFGLINEKNKIVIPILYDTLSVLLMGSSYEEEKANDYAVVVALHKKFGTVNLYGQVQIPLQYAALQRISKQGLYKAKIGSHYQIINAKNQVINKGPFDEVANFEVQHSFRYSEQPTYTALTFYKGKMQVIDQTGKFISTEVFMMPHEGYQTFDELKNALVKALDSPKDSLLFDFACKIAPSNHMLYYLKTNIFTENNLGYTDIYRVRDKYYKDLLQFKYSYWKNDDYSFYNRASLTQVTDYTFENEDLVTNGRNTDHAFGDTRFMEKLLRNAIKVNGYWISSYFMYRNFDN